MAQGTTDSTTDPADTVQKSRGVRRSFLIGLVGVFVLPAAAGALLGLLGGGLFWWMDLFNHFWVHYAALFAAATVGLLLLGGRRLLILSVVMLGLSAWQVWPIYESRDQVEPGQYDFTLIQFNVNTQGGDKQAVAAYLREQDADVVFLQEISPAWLDALSGQVGDYELVIAEPRNDNFGIACFVRAGQGRVKVQSAKIVDLTDGVAGVPAIELELLVDDWLGPRTVPVLSLHTLPPVSVDYAKARDAQLAAAAAWASQGRPTEAGRRAIVIGDLNATPWSKPFLEMLEACELQLQDGFGRQTTWPAGLPAVLGIPIDHCLHGGGLNTIERRVGEPCGSDHRPVHVTLRISGC